ncbi:MAG: hypothetical protein H8E44_06670 [Planctomycetes bacterium]|nr:hypothetical protein [Planctomycetota bacterium]
MSIVSVIVVDDPGFEKPVDEFIHLKGLVDLSLAFLHYADVHNAQLRHVKRKRLDKNRGVM